MGLVHGAEAVLDLTGWQDPNHVPVNAFYTPVTGTNHLALLAQDTSWRVRSAPKTGCMQARSAQLSWCNATAACKQGHCSMQVLMLAPP